MIDSGPTGQHLPVPRKDKCAGREQGQAGIRNAAKTSFGVSPRRVSHESYHIWKIHHGDGIVFLPTLDAPEGDRSAVFVVNAGRRFSGCPSQRSREYRIGHTRSRLSVRD